MQSVNPEHVVKKIDSIRRSGGESHWVGNGFPVRTLFSYSNLGVALSPFLLLDYAGPMEFAPTSERLGVGAHPHRGFETVTIVYQGSVEHRDSSGGGGSIGQGDVQWMTAASGIIHEEFHGRDLARHGGTWEMVQLWVNLPAQEKIAAPRYQALLKEWIPIADLPDGAGTVRIIAGEFRGVKGPAKTFTPINLWDLHLTNDRRIYLAVPAGYTTALVVLKGRLRLNGSETVSEAEVAVLDQIGGGVYIDNAHAVTALLLSGEPINEPIAGRGPFVMNTTQEVQQAMLDYQSGKMGQMA